MNRQASWFYLCVSKGLIAMNRPYEQCKFYEGQHLFGAGLQVQRLSLLSSRQKHGSIQASMVQEVLTLHPHPKEARNRVSIFKQQGGGSQSPSLE